MNPYIADLTRKTARDEELAGGKGANLARLIQHGFQVPPGFVITTAAFQKLELDGEIESLQCGKYFLQFCMDSGLASGDHHAVDELAPGLHFIQD